MKHLTDFIYRVRTEIKWRLKNKPVPPPHFIKQRIIKKYARKFSLKVFVETGTYKGSTTMAVKDLFEEIFTIELDRALFQNAREIFAKFPHIFTFQGDSAEVLPVVLERIGRPALFWLDGHYSGGITAKGSLNTPILRELQLILGHSIKGHVILIDDARCFTGQDDYPTIPELESFIKKINPGLILEVGEDIIRITGCL